MSTDSRLSLIRVAQSRAQEIDYMKLQVEEIRKLVMKRDVGALKEKFKELVPEYCAVDNSCIEETDMQELVKSLNS